MTSYGVLASRESHSWRLALSALASASLSTPDMPRQMPITASWSTPAAAKAPALTPSQDVLNALCIRSVRQNKKRSPPARVCTEACGVAQGLGGTLLIVGCSRLLMIVMAQLECSRTSKRGKAGTCDCTPQGAQRCLLSYTVPAPTRTLCELHRGYRGQTSRRLY